VIKYSLLCATFATCSIAGAWTGNPLVIFEEIQAGEEIIEDLVI